MTVYSFSMKRLFGMMLTVMIAAAALVVGEATGGVSPAAASGAAAGSAGAPAGRAEGASGGAVAAQPTDREDGEQEMRALAAGYHGLVQELRYRDGDWALRVGQSWFYWAHGRLLPESLRERWREYASYRFYPYPRELPPVPRLDEEAKARLQERLERQEEDPPRRYSGFLDTLYGAATRRATEAQIVTVRLLGFQVRVHRQVAEQLAAVDGELRRLSQSDPEVRRFFAAIKGIAGYNWRPIAGTRSRSYHGYGIALDLIPRSYGGRHTYWRWAMPSVEEWWSIPYSQRWMVPLRVVRAFEDHGFIWGGKWFFFDTMHFEYRPELLVLSRRRAAP